MLKSRFARPSLALVAAVLTLCTPLVAAKDNPAAPTADKKTAGPSVSVVARQEKPVNLKAKAALSHAPLAFEANQGQVDSRVQYLSRGAGYNLFLTRDEAVLTLANKNGQPDVLRVKLTGSDAKSKVSAIERLGWNSNYFIGNDPAKWRKNVPNYRKVQFDAVYPGISLVYYGNQQQLEHDFVVAPNADPKQIAMEISGAKNLTIDEHGDLVIATARGEVRFEKPIVYQDVNGARQEVAGKFNLDKDQKVRFEIAAYDKSKALIIDPVINFGTLLSASAGVSATGVAVDGAGNSYVVGVTSAATFPGSSPVTFGGGSDDAYILKVSPNGSSLGYVTFIGSTGNDTVNGVTLDGIADVFITGNTPCTAAGSTSFPTTTDSFQQAGVCPDVSVGYVTMIDPTGATLMYSTLYGGDLDTTGNAIATFVNPVTTLTQAAFTGHTTSSANPLPITVNAFQGSIGGVQDAFLAVINPNFQAISTAAGSATCDGGGNSTIDFGVGTTPAFSVNEQVFISGVTQDAGPDLAFNTTPGNHSRVEAINGTTITVVDAGCNDNTDVGHGGTVTGGLVYGSYLGGADGVSTSDGRAIAVRDVNTLYVAGSTNSAVFPTNGGAQTVLGGAQDGFITSFDSAAGAAGVINASTYVGGSDVDTVNGIAIVPGGANPVYVVGQTFSADLPLTAGSAQPAPGDALPGGPGDAFISEFDSVLATNAVASYLGGTGADNALAVSLAPGGGFLWIAGSTTTPTGDNVFNTHALTGGLSGAQDGFIAKFDTSLTDKSVATYFGGNGSIDSMNAIVATAADTAIVAGTSDSTDLYSPAFPTSASVSGAAFQTTPASANPAGFAAKFSANQTDLANHLTFSPALILPTVDPLGFTPGHLSTVYNVNVANGAGVDAHNVTLDLHMDLSKLSITGIVAPGGTCVQGQAGNASSGITCDFGTLTTLNSTSVQVNVDLQPAGACTGACTASTITTAATVGAAEAASNASTTITTNVVPVTDMHVNGISAQANSTIAPNKFVVQKDTAFTYVATITNQGTNMAPNVNVTITLPLGFIATTVNIPGGSCPGGPQTGTVVCSLTNRPGGSIDFLTVIGDPTSLLAGNVASTTNQLDLSVAVSPNANSYFDTNTGNDSAASTNNTLERDVALTIPAMTATANLNGAHFVEQLDSTIAYQVTVQNAGPSDATNSILAIQFPAGSALPVQPGACSGGTTNFNGGTGLETCDLGNALTVAAGPVPVTFTVTPPALGAGPTALLTANATLTAAAINSGLNTNTASTTQERVAVISSSVAPTAAGTDTAEQQVGTVSYTVKAHNAGPSNAPNVRLQVTLDTGVASNFTALLGSDAGCSTAGQTVTCVSGTPITAGSDYTVTFTAVAPATINGNAAPATQVFTDNVIGDTFPISVVQDIAGNPALTAPSSAPTTIERRSDLSVGALTATAGPTALSGNISLDLTAGSSNTNYAIPGSTVVYTLKPTGPAVSFTSGGTVNVGLTTGATCINSTPAPAANLSITCTIASLANAGQAVHLVIGTPTTDNVNAGTVASASFTSSACIAGPVTAASDPGNGCAAAGNNVSTTAGVDPSSQIQRQADLDINTVPFAAGPNTVSLSGPLSYFYTVKNNGPDTALNVKSTIALTSSAVSPGGDIVVLSPVGCVRNGANIDCSIASIANGASVPVVVQITPPLLTSMTGLTAAATDTLNGALSLGAQVSSVDNNNANDTNGTTTGTTLQRTSDVSIAAQPFTATSSAASNGGAVTNTTITTNLSGTMTMTFGLTNAGPDTALNSKVQLTHVSGAIATPISGITSSGNATCSLVGADIQCSVTNVPTGPATTVTVNFTPPTLNSMTVAGGASPTGAFTSTAKLNPQTSYVDATNDTNAQTVTTNLQRQSNIQMTFGGATFTALPSPVDLTGTITYAYNYKNLGPDPALKLATRITLTTAGITNPEVFQTAGSTYDIGAGPVALANVAINGCQVTSNTTLDCEVDGPVPVGIGAGFVVKASPPLTTNLFNGAATDAVFNNLAASSTAVVDNNLGDNASPSTITTNIQRTADLAVNSVAATSLTAGAVNAGPSFVEQRDATIRFDFTVQNLGASDSPATILTVNFPAGSLLSAQPAACSGGTTNYNAGTATETCDLGTLTVAAGATQISFTVTPPALAAGSAFVGLSAQGSISGGVIDATPANNSKVALITQERDVALTIPTMTATPNVSGAGQPFVDGKDATISYSLNVANGGPSNATNVVLNFNLPAGSLLPVQPAACTGGSNFNIGTAVETCNIGAIANGANMAVVFVVTPPALAANTPTTVLSALASLNTTSAVVSGNSSNAVNITQERDADLSSTISVPASTTLDVGPSFDTVSNGHQQVTFTIVAANAGPSPATNVKVTDVLPAGFNFTSFTSTLGGVNCTGAGSPVVVTCDFGATALASAATNTITITATATAASLNNALASNIVTNSASIASTTLNDPNPGNNSSPVAASVTLHGEANLSITTITPTPFTSAPLHVGDDLVYAVTVSNAGPHPSQLNLAFSNVLPAGVTPVSITPGSGGTTCTLAATTTCTLAGGIAAGGVEVETIRVHVPATAVGALADSADVHTPANPVIDAEDPIVTNSGNNNTTALAAADVALAEAAAPTPTFGGNPTVFTVTLTNPAPAAYTPGAPNPIIGGSASTGVTVHNVVTIVPTTSVGGGVTGISNNFGGACPATATFTAGTATFDCTGGTVASNATNTVTFTLTPTALGTMTATASITASAVFDPNAANNTANTNDATVNTPICATGTCAAIAPVDPVSGNNPLTSPQASSVTFNNVTTQGATTLAVSNQPAACLVLDSTTPAQGPVGSLAALVNNSLHVPFHGNVVNPSRSGTFACGSGTQPLFYDLATSAVTAGGATVCVNYSGTNFHKSDRVRMLNLTGGNVQDITIASGFSSTTVCGQVPALSTATGTVRLAVMEPSNAMPNLVAATVTVDTTSSARGSAGAALILTAAGTSDNDGPDACLASSVNTCSGGNSNDANLTYSWTSAAFLNAGAKIGITPAEQPLTSTGTVQVTLTVSDPYGNSEVKVFTVVINTTGGGGGGGSTGSGLISTATVNKGQAASFTTALDNSSGSTSGPIVVANATALAANQISCSVSPSTLPGGAVSTTVTVLCSTQGQVFGKLTAPKVGPDKDDMPLLAGMVGITGLPLLGMLLVPGKSRRRKLMKMWAAIGLILIFTMFQAACGGGASSGFGGAPQLKNAGTPNGTYQVVLTPLPTGVTPSLVPDSTGTTLVPATTTFTLTVQ